LRSESAEVTSLQSVTSDGSSEEAQQADCLMRIRDVSFIWNSAGAIEPGSYL